MAKLKNPLMSLKATGGFTKLFSLAKRRGRHIIERKPIPTDAKSPTQLFYRHMFTKCVDLWHLLSEAERQAWESAARPKHMTGYAWYISQCLRPNPGIYLPLQGGTMSGVIEMDGEHIHGLPAPVHLQDPLRRQDYIDYIQPFLYAHGARVYHSANQAIPTATATALAFDTEDWDTDSIHDNIANNSRLTCKTAGKYLVIADVEWTGNAVGVRAIHIYKNGAVAIFGTEDDTASAGDRTMVVPLTQSLAVNDFVEAIVWQTSGGPLNARGGQTFRSSFSMQRIG